MTKPKTILLTGSTSGIGLETAKVLVNYASDLILPVRNLDKGRALAKELLTINPNCKITYLECNLNSIRSIKDCCDKIREKFDTIDILINNAGIWAKDKIITEDGLEETFQVNVLSQFLFNTELTPLVKNSIQGRIINLSSSAHYFGSKLDIDDLEAKNLKGGIRSGSELYFRSNFARNLLTFHQAEQLKGTKITVNCVHPGVIKTNLGLQNEGLRVAIFTKIFQMFTKPTAEGAQTIIYLATSEEGGKITGEYWDNCKVKKPLAKSRDKELAKQLWNKCQKIVTDSKS